MNYLRFAAAIAATVLVPLASAQDQPAAIGVATEAAGKRTAPTNLVVGIVDLARAIEQFPKAIELQKKLVELSKTSRAQLDDVTKRMEEVRGAIDVLGPDAVDRRMHEGNLQLLQLQRQIKAKDLDERFEMERVKMMLEIYSDIDVAIAKVAKARGLHLVHCTHEDPEPETDVRKLNGRLAMSRLQQYETRTIWYAAAELDVTADLIKLLLVPVASEPAKDGKVGDAKSVDAKAFEKGAAPGSDGKGSGGSGKEKE